MTYSYRSWPRRRLHASDVGAKSRDRIPISEWRRGHETVARMQAAGWQVISKCRACSLVMDVDLDLIVWRSGAAISLWNRAPRCRRLGCQGHVEFQAKIPAVGFYSALIAPRPGER